jgi:transposase
VAKSAGATGEEQPKALASARDTQSWAAICELEACLKEDRPTPSLRMAKAVTNLRNQWKFLVRFFDDATIPLANGASELAMRGPVQGRKSHYGSRSDLGTRVAALMYRLIETRKQLGVPPPPPPPPPPT